MANFLSPLFNEQTFTANGDPAVGYKINTYEAGTSTPIATFTTKTGSTAQSNPIVLNARGAPDDVIWLAQGVSYKFVLTDANDVVIDTFDDISGMNDTSVSAGEWTASGYTPTYIGATSLSLVGDRTGEFLVGRRIRTTNTGGATYSLITVSSYNSGTGLTTVTVSNDSGTLDAGLSAVDLAILTPDNPSLPNSPEARKSLGLGTGADIASASTLPLAARTGNLVRVTGTVATAATDLENGGQVWCYAVGAWPLTYHATNMPVQGGANYTCSPGDIIFMSRDGSGVLTVLVHKADGTGTRTVNVSGNQTVAGTKTFSSAAVLQAGATFGSATLANVSTSAPLFGARAFGVFDGRTTGTFAANNSGNVTSVTRNALGDYTVTLSVSLADATFVVIPSCRNTSVATYAIWKAESDTANTINIQTKQEGGALVDCAYVGFAVFRT